MRAYLVCFFALVLQFAYSSCDEVKPVPFTHRNCRNSVYFNSTVERYPILEFLVDWKVNYPQYRPEFYESPKLYNKPYADPPIDDPNFKPKWNSIDQGINRISFHGEYEIRGKYPINMAGRTGISGRGLMKRWGVNHAGDCIVTRWQRGVKGELIKDETTGKKKLQVLLIQRKDNLMWAFPGGKVDPYEKPIDAMKREFVEEALNFTRVPEVDELFSGNGTEIYTGYVDDPRNTDNAWFETTAYNFHDETGKLLIDVKFIASDDAKAIKWTDIDRYLELYASHAFILSKTALHLNAHW